MSNKCNGITVAAQESLQTRAESYLEWCYAQETAPHIAEFAHFAGTTVPTLMRHFRADYDTTPAAYLKASRIKRATLLLIATEVPLNKIAYQAGFGTRTTLFRAFKAATGLTPKAYRAVHRPH